VIGERAQYGIDDVKPLFDWSEELVFAREMCSTYSDEL
jgi:hypothetical protein